jgi:hypothetical protein
MFVPNFRALPLRGKILRALQRLLHLLGVSIDAHS